MRYASIYVEKTGLPCDNTIWRTGECCVLSVITCFTPFFVNYASIRVDSHKIEVATLDRCGNELEDSGKVVSACQWTHWHNNHEA